MGEYGICMGEYGISLFLIPQNAMCGDRNSLGALILCVVHTRRSRNPRKVFLPMLWEVEVFAIQQILNRCSQICIDKQAVSFRAHWAVGQHFISQGLR